jgi:signal transduction histidine kinase
MSTGRSSPRTIPEALTRTLRHEVGDLLQTLYATVAILQRRLPADWTQERRVLADLRSRAEACKNLLDIAHDYACPLTLNYTSVDLSELTGRLVAAAERRFPKLEIKSDYRTKCTLSADEVRLAQIGELLLEHACESARKQVQVEVNCAPEEVTWAVADDGPEIGREQQEQLLTPQGATRQGRPALGLALVQKLVALQGGRIQTESATPTGFRVSVSLPRAAHEPQLNQDCFRGTD